MKPQTQRHSILPYLLAMVVLGCTSIPVVEGQTIAPAEAGGEKVESVPATKAPDTHDRGKAEVAGFFAKVRELSGGSIRTELLDLLDGENFAIALVRVFAEREGKTLDGQFQAFTYRIANGTIAAFWFMVWDRYAGAAFWS